MTRVFIGVVRSIVGGARLGRRPRPESLAMARAPDRPSPTKAGSPGAPLTIVLRLFFLALLLAGPGVALAAPASFDLAGPRLDVRVTDAGVTLPIAEVPNLVAG